MKNSFRPANYTLTLRPVTIALLFLFFLTMSRSAYGQWTTTGSDIYNSNSGNVGIGTNGAPTATLEVKKSQNAPTTVTVDNPNTTAGNLSYSGFVMKQNGVIRAHIASVNDNHSFIPAGTAQFWNFMNAPMVFATNNTEQMRISATGNVGIGTNAPDVKLQIHHASTNTNLANVNFPDLPFIIRNSSSTNGNMSLIDFQDAAGYGNVLFGAIQKDQTNHYADMVFFTRNGTTSLGERMRIASTGKVGIGVTAPTAWLTVNSDGEAFRMYRNANTPVWGVSQYFALNNSSGAAVDYAQIGGGIVTNTAGAENGVLAFYTRGAGTIGERMRITEGGTVGIGLPNPNATYRLDVSGSINTSGSLCIANDCKASWSAVGGNSQWTTSGTTINYSTGNVGIGVPAPATKLDVAGTVDADAFTVNGSAVVSSQWANGTGTINYAGGNVGIATPVPTEKLHVTGNVKVIGSIDVSGNINAKYQDVAEWVESSQELPAGTVVVLDDTKSNQVVASTQAYDSRVAGVISLKPGIALGERGDNHVLVATTGRVKVKVDATNGAIKIGDLLVTSDKEGVAMKSLPIEVGGARIHRPGTLIGKALEPLAHGTSEILVLLSLQ